MMEKLCTWLDPKKPDPEKKNRPVSLLFVLGLGGMLLILLSDFFTPKQQAQAETAPPRQTGYSEAEYVARLEERLGEMIRQVDGAGETAVMITLDSSREMVYAQNEKNAGEGGGYEYAHVLLDAASGEEPLVEMTWEPEIRGVAVVCQGGGNVTVAARVTELVSVVLGVPSHRISIAKMS